MLEFKILVEMEVVKNVKQDLVVNLDDWWSSQSIYIYREREKKYISGLYDVYFHTSLPKYFMNYNLRLFTCIIQVLYLVFMQRYFINVCFLVNKVSKKI